MNPDETTTAHIGDLARSINGMREAAMDIAINTHTPTSYDDRAADLAETQRDLDRAIDSFDAAASGYNSAVKNYTYAETGCRAGTYAGSNATLRTASAELTVACGMYTAAAGVLTLAVEAHALAHALASGEYGTGGYGLSDIYNGIDAVTRFDTSLMRVRDGLRSIAESVTSARSAGVTSEQLPFIRP